MTCSNRCRLVALWSSLATGLPALCAATEIRPYLSLMAMEWTETVAGQTLLTEDGYWFGIGLDIQSPVRETVRWDVRSEFFFGRVNYDGLLMDPVGTIEPFRTHTLYSGLRLESDVAFLPVPHQRIEVRPLLGLGLRYWLRSLDEGQEFGYDEYWLTVYARGGLELTSKTEDTVVWYLRGVALIPLYNREDVENLNFDGVRSLSLRPGKRPGMVIEAGRRGPRFDLGLVVELLQFSESDLDSSGRFFQPESELNLVGLRAGMLF